MRRACIDIGSNTTRLLVADCVNETLIEVYQERAFTQIGRSLDAEGTIPQGKLDEVTAAVAGQLASARRMGVTEVRCVATAGVRRAANGGALVSQLERACDGLSVTVLSGDDEGRLAFLGAAWGCRQNNQLLPDGSLGVVDIGGGSCELVVGSPPDHIGWCRSVSIGSSDLLRAEILSDPPLADECARASARVHDAFAGLEPPAVGRIVAVGGSAASLTRIVGPLLDQGALGLTLELLQRLPAAEVANQYELDVQRVRLLPSGILILMEVASLFGMALTVGGAGLREGLLLDW
jgi:exopolyphosphatase / guanosine-5'-triphosphate,3'-diphosphate pyrophosphatase